METGKLGKKMNDKIRLFVKIQSGCDLFDIFHVKRKISAFSNERELVALACWNISIFTRPQPPTHRERHSCTTGVQLLHIGRAPI